MDNFQAAVLAIKRLLPWIVLFYAIDFFLYYQAGPGYYREAQLVSNIMISSLFLLGFWLIDFFRIRAQMKSPPQPQVVVVQQPVYVPAPPGYQGPPYPPPPPPPSLPPQPAQQPRPPGGLP